MTATGRFTFIAEATIAASASVSAVARQIDRGSATLAQTSSLSAIGGLKWTEEEVQAATYTEQTATATWTDQTNPSTTWTNLDNDKAA